MTCEFKVIRVSCFMTLIIYALKIYEKQYYMMDVINFDCSLCQSFFPKQ